MQTEETTFEALGLSASVLEALTAKGFSRPTPVQALTIPALLRNDRDLVASAQTGTGKTAAFGIPLIERLSPVGTPQALVMTPTRELALQVTDEMMSLQPRRGGLRFVTVYGGQAIGVQARELNRGVDIVVGTPGRIKDMLSRGLLELSSVRWFILDEADEMLKMGFIEDVEEILSAAHPERRVLLFSATMPKPILRLAEKYLTDYELLAVASTQRTSHLTRQYAIEVPRDAKGLVLCRLIDAEPDFYGLVFAPTRDLCDEISQELGRRGFPAEALHGDISQPMREKVLARFREKRVKILVATDVAARGIDIPEMTHVVNFEPPREVDSYVHRVGRTGRAGKEGVAITLVGGGWDFRRLNTIRQVTQTTIEEISIPSLAQISEAKQRALFDSIREAAIDGADPEAAVLSEELLRQFSPSELVSALLELGWKRVFDVTRHPELPEPRRGRRDAPPREVRPSFREERPPFREERRDRSDRQGRSDRPVGPIRRVRKEEPSRYDRQEGRAPKRFERSEPQPFDRRDRRDPRREEPSLLKPERSRVAKPPRSPAIPAASVPTDPAKPLTRAQRRALQFGHVLDEHGNIVATKK